jgi:hypothetical protein
MKERDCGSYIEDIVEHMNYAKEFIIIKNLTFEEFVNDKKTVLSVTKCIKVVVEMTLSNLGGKHKCRPGCGFISDTLERIKCHDLIILR